MAISRLGGIGGNFPTAPTAANTRALFLKQFAGEVLTAFEEKNIAMPLHRVRTISNGKSAQFPLTGTASAAYHTPGSPISGDSIKHNEITVSVDDLLISSAFIPRIDEAMNHYDVRSIYSSELGNALANVADKNIFKIIAAASGKSADDIIGAGGGTVNVGANAAGVSGAKVADGIFAALQKFDETNVGGEKVAVLTPNAYYALFGSDSVSIQNMAYMNKDVGGSGGIASGTAPTIGGVQVYMSNHIPTANESSSNTTTKNPVEGDRAGSYHGTGFNNTLTQGLVFSKDAAATVKLLDLGVESEYQIDRQGTLMVAKYAMGHNVLRPECAVRMVTTA